MTMMRHVLWPTILKMGLRSVLLAALLSTLILPSRAADISYVYDNLGRLVAVIDPATDTAVYAYDAVGNLTGITRQASSTVALFQFTPSSGPVGTNVTIYGTGFSATPASNTVQFNGTTATVLTATSTVLTTTVPSGASTGPISVTVGGSTATSATNFTVGTAGAPTLSSMSPAVGNYGDTVTLTGTNYEPTLINNRVAFAGAIGAVATATSTTLTVPVPSSAQTGPIAVSTPKGKATSSTEFYVAPPGVIAADIQYTGRITVNGATVVASMPTANKNGLLVFDGTAGQRINLGFSSVTVTQFYVTVYRPDGAALTTPVLYTTTGGGLDVGLLPVTGTYTIILDPVSTYTGNITVTGSTELAGTITPGGSAVPIAISRIGQNARLTLTASAGSTVSLQLSSVTITSGMVSILKPDGTNLVAPTSFGTSGTVLDTQVLPASGTYAILLDPSGTSTGNATVTLYNTSDVTGTITMDGSTVTPTLTVPGQRARYTFSGTAGQWVNLGVSSVSITSSSISMLKADGTSVAVGTIYASGGSVDPIATLPDTDTYTIVVDPQGTYTGSLTLTLSSALTGTLTLDGGGVPVSLARVGQRARYTFSGTAGQWLSLGLTAVTIGGNTTVTLLKPDGTTVASGSVSTSGGGIEPPASLPTTGTYTVVVDPAGVNTGNITLNLMSDLSGVLNLDGTPTTSTLSTVGQNAVYTFTGTAGQWVSLGFTGVTIPSVGMTLYKPDGTYLTGTSVGTGGGSLDLAAPFPATGTYTLLVNPSGSYTGAATLTLSSEVTGTLTLNDPATTVTIGRVGQNGRYTFSGTSGQSVTVRVTGNTLGSTAVTLYTPSGGYQTGATNAAASFNLSTVTLGSTGSYTVTINPQTTATGSLNLQVTTP